MNNCRIKDIELFSVNIKRILSQSQRIVIICRDNRRYSYNPKIITRQRQSSA